MPAKRAPQQSAQQETKTVPNVYPLKAGLIDIGVNLTDGMYRGFYNHSNHSSHEADLDLVVDRAASMGVVGLIITGGNMEESQHAVELAIAQNRRLREKWGAAPNGGNKNTPSNKKELDGADETVSTGAKSVGAASSPPPLKCYATVGCHPTRTCEMKKDMKGYLDGLRAIISKHSVRNLHRSKEGGEATVASAASATSSSASTVDPDSCVVVAIGECGLDYDRLHFTGKEQQLIGFEAQFALVDEFCLPMFLHDRNTGTDFSDIMRRHKGILERCGGGVVHSFTSDEKTLQTLLDLNLYIGINGCSMKTQENLDAVKKVPLNRLMLETDGPWCEIKKAHESFQYLDKSPAQLQMTATFAMGKKEKFVMGALVKSRYEPVQMIEVLEVVFQLRKDEPEIKNDREALAAIVRKNTETLFPLR